MINALQEAATQIVANGTISAQEVENLRPLIWFAPELSDIQLRELVRISEALREPNAAFSDFFAEAVVHFLLRQSEPQYYLQEQSIAWIEARLVPDDMIDAHAKLETMVRVLEQAMNAPERYKDWVLDAVERSVLSGQGPTRMGGNIAPGVVDRDDAIYLRRILFARGGKGASHVTADEAERLFRIKDVVREAMNAPEWEILFVQACGNFLMAHTGKGMLSAEEAERLERVIDDNRPHIARFLVRMGEMRNLVRALGWAIDDGEDPGAHDRAVADAVRLSAEEVAWLRHQIAADGRTDRYEKALLTFLADETGKLPPVLEQLRRTA